jgi:hypothetical protein
MRTEAGRAAIRVVRAEKVVQGILTVVPQCSEMGSKPTIVTQAYPTAGTYVPDTAFGC